MSEPRLISPMLDNYLMGDPVSEHDGVRCCPAMHKDTEEKYLVKIISVPANKGSLDALLLTGAYANEAEASSYFEELANDVVNEIQVLNKLSELEGFLPFEAYQMEPMEDTIGYDIYILSSYKRTLEKQFKRVPMTHLSAINLGIDLCAALTVCRRSGYIYADLKPGNVYVCDGGAYRIGDLGFLPLNGLKYTSLPDKYRSAYTAPEITDAFSDLNTTIDIYAAGLILYQAYNDGILPSYEGLEPGAALPAPAYADYEIAEIILKACAYNPEDRWQDPEEMGQALISYMQRNGVNDTPIVPQNSPEQIEEETVIDDAQTYSESNSENIDEPVGLYEQSESEDLQQDVQNESESDATDFADAEVTEDSIYTEDEHGNLTFLDEDSSDETAPENDIDNVNYDEVSDEVSEIMNQADALISHPTPDPVVPPEKIDIPMPEPIVIEEQTVEEQVDEFSEVSETNNDDNAEEATIDDADDDDEATDEEQTDELPVKVGKLVRNVCIAFAALILILGAFFYYRFVYTQHVSIQVTGSEGVLTVYVDSKFDEEKLTVVCTDTYGNQLTKPVEDGKSVFTDLLPNAAYTVEVKVQGFHRLTGKTSTAYSTPSQTTIVQFSAVCGAEDGSAILNFAVDGIDADQWKIRYNASDETEKEVIFTGHIATVNGLTIGKEYTFTVEPLDAEFFTGENTIKFIASKLVRAENLEIVSFADGKLSVKWSSPADVSVESWSVHCYDGADYNETILVTTNSAEFTDIDVDSSYTVEVTAAGMHYGEQIFVAKNPLHITNFAANVKTPETITLRWDSDNTVSDAGWVLKYKLDQSAEKEISGFKDNSVQIPGVPAGSICNFTLTAADGAPVFDGTFSFTMPQTETFNRFQLTPEDLIIYMCHTPNNSNWTYRDIDIGDYTKTYDIGDRASFLLTLLKIRGESTDEVTTTCIIKDSAGNVVSIGSETEVWDEMWDNGHCGFDLPDLPTVAGEYTVYVYFDAHLLLSDNFTME